MKLFALVGLLSFASSLSAAENMCATYAKYPRYMKAIETVAAYQNYTTEEFCNHPGILAIEAQPSRIILRDGTVIPHVTVQKHLEYSSCLYMVSDIDQSITKANCYSGM